MISFTFLLLCALSCPLCPGCRYRREENDIYIYISMCLMSLIDSSIYRRKTMESLYSSSEMFIMKYRRVLS